MKPTIEINGEWYECEFLYPFKEPPITIPRPLGTSRWLPPKYNAKLVLNITITSGRYNINFSGKQLVFEAERHTIDGLLGNV